MISLLKILNELEINKPIKIWDFKKYIPNFNPDNIKVGDKIIFPSDSNYDSPSPVYKIEKDIIFAGEDDIEYNGFKKRLFKKFNKENKKSLNELEINNPLISNYKWVLSVIQDQESDDITDKFEKQFKGKNISKDEFYKFYKNNIKYIDEAYLKEIWDWVMEKVKRPINELEIKNPTVNKKTLFEELKNNHIHLLYDVTTSTSLKNLYMDEGWPTLESYLEENYGYDEEMVSYLVELIKKYYSAFKYGEVMMLSNPTNHGKELKQDISMYKTLELFEDDGGMYLILHNFK